MPVDYSRYTENLRVDVRDGVMTLALHNPEMNANTDAMHWSLSRIWDDIDADSDVSVVIFTGSGERAFSAGGNPNGAMADIAGIPYASIALSALIPAVLYFLAVGLMVHFEAVRVGLKGLPDEEVPPFRKSLRNIHLLIPLVELVYALATGYTAFWAAFVAIVLSAAVSFFRAETRLTWRKTWDALEKGGKDMLLIATATAYR